MSDRRYTIAEAIARERLPAWFPVSFDSESYRQWLVRQPSARVNCVNLVSLVAMHRLDEALDFSRWALAVAHGLR